MSTFTKRNERKRCSRSKTLALAAVAAISLANNFPGLTARAAVRLPDEAISVEPWMFPANDNPAVVDPVAIQQLAPPVDVQRRAALGKGTPDRARRPGGSRREKRDLVESLGLVGWPSEEQTLIKSFEKFSACREFVAINC